MEYPHKNDAQLELYALGRLTEPQVRTVEEHLLVCVACQETLDDFEVFASSMRQALSAEAGVQLRAGWRERLSFRGMRPPALAWATAFAVLVFSAGLYLRPGDNIAPLASLQLTAMRGNSQTVPTAKETDIALRDAPALPSLLAEVVDSTGRAVWAGDFENRRKIRLMKQLAPGDYFVRLYGGNGKLLHEYGFQVRPIINSGMQY